MRTVITSNTNTFYAVCNFLLMLWILTLGKSDNNKLCKIKQNLYSWAFATKTLKTSQFFIFWNVRVAKDLETSTIRAVFYWMRWYCPVTFQKSNSTAEVFLSYLFKKYSVQLVFKIVVMYVFSSQLLILLTHLTPMLHSHKNQSINTVAVSQRYSLKKMF